MTNRLECPNPVCDAPMSTCNLGSSRLADCPHWQHVAGAAPETQDEVAEPVLPWIGDPLGELDLEIVTARSAPYLIGLVGAHDAGKTTLLTSLYILLWQGRFLARHSFAGSYTLRGWEGLAHALSWSPGQPPRFPAHTSRASGRTPGLLHLALRQDGRTLRDVLLTDAPGEWFESWAVDRSAPGADGARWTFRHAGAFVLVIDSEALAGPRRGLARGQIIGLMRRMGDEIAGRRVAVVWAKSDCSVPDGIRDVIRQTICAAFPDHREFRVSVYPDAASSEEPGNGFLEVFDWLLEPARRRIAEPVPAPVAPSDAFLAFRGE
jgi:hypothetical protein